jgi:hypothetical protein
MSLNRAFELFTTKLVSDLRDNLKTKLKAKSKKGHSGDSRLGASIKVKYYESGGVIYGFQLLMNDYYYWVNIGRDKGGVSQEGQKNIARWIKTRGLQPAISDKSKKQIKGFKY